MSQDNNTQPTSETPSSYEQGRDGAKSTVEGFFKDPGAAFSGIQDSEFGKKASEYANSAWDTVKNLPASHWFGGVLGAVAGWLLSSLFGLPGWFNLPVMAGLVIGGGYIGITQFGPALKNLFNATSSPENYRESYNQQLGYQAQPEMQFNAPGMYEERMAFRSHPQVQFGGHYTQGYMPPPPGPLIPEMPRPGLNFPH